MDLESAIRAYLIAGATSAGNRIYELVLPATATMPAITLQRISNIGHPDIHVDFPRLQVSAWGSTPLQARQLADEIEELLYRYKGILSGIRIKRCSKMPSIGVIEDRAAGLIHIPVDYQILYVKE